MSSKPQIRKEARRVRDFITLDDEDPEQAVPHFFDTIKPEQGQVIGGYWPKGKEFDVTPILDKLLQDGFKIGLPIIEDGSKILKFAEWSQDIKLIKGPYGIMQPETSKDTQWLEPDIFLVPFLAFDRSGYRIGQGGAYYDTTLNVARMERDVVAVGVGYAKQAVLFNLPAEPHDEVLDWVITPLGTHYFGD